jgi:HAD superfamily hydrolase (TIGR01509 family)
MSDVRAVVFDMDGVIVDSERYWEGVMEAVIEEAVTDSDVTPADLTGVNVLDQHAMLAERDAVSVDRDAYFDLYDRKARSIYTERASLMDGFHHLLDALRDRGLALALVTSSFPEWVEMVFERFDLDGRFDAVVSAAELDRPGKPEPDIYEHAAAELGVDPGECVVVEDSESGATAAHRAGAYVVGYQPDPDSGQDLSVADEVVGGPEELRERLLAVVGDAAGPASG